MKKNIYTLLLVAFLQLCTGCGNYLDIVPDNVATVENAFTMRITAERYLFTCYSYLPDLGNVSANVALLSGDELFFQLQDKNSAFQIARGYQKVVDPYMNFWQGANGGKDLYQAIRECNVFLDNVGKVPDLDDMEKGRWTAEAKFLKAYFHFYLVRLYGPIPLMKENVPVDARDESIYPYQATIDECFEYITKLLDEAIPYLPLKIENEQTELGRLTQPIGYSLKAIVKVTAASPFFNGNNDYRNFRNKKGNLLFNQENSTQKWLDAAEACKTAIESCESQGYRLYEFTPDFFQYKISDTTKRELSLRNSFCEKWNSEIIWGNTNSMSGTTTQSFAIPRGLDPSKVDNHVPKGSIAPSLKVAEQFYSENGVPISEDRYYDYAGRYGLKVGDDASQLYVRKGYATVKLHFNREPRFYANIGFDGGVWYGQGKLDDQKPDDLFFVSSKNGQPAAPISLGSYSITGYFVKKLVHYESIIGTGSTFTPKSYPWPMIRLSNLYLLYSEALNEAGEQPTKEVYKWVNEVRKRAGLLSVEASWEAYSTNPAKYKSKEGMREIIQQERLNELAFEGQRFWDLRRWKRCMTELNQPIVGWDLSQPDAPSYYRKKVNFNQTFSTRDYLWPINENEMLANKNLVQTPGW